MLRKPDERPYCQAETRSQQVGSSYASNTWKCPWRATTTYRGLPVCKTHKKMLERDSGDDEGERDV